MDSPNSHMYNARAGNSYTRNSSCCGGRLYTGPVNQSTADSIQKLNVQHYYSNYCPRRGTIREGKTCHTVASSVGLVLDLFRDCLLRSLSAKLSAVGRMLKRPVIRQSSIRSAFMLLVSGSAIIVDVSIHRG